MLTTLKKAVQNAFHRLVNSAQTGLEALARSIATNGGEVLVAAAAAAVAAAEAQGGSGEQKFRAAQAAVVAALGSTQGWERHNMAFGAAMQRHFHLIEAAVAQLHA